MLHDHVSDNQQDNAAPYKTRLGVWMCAIYAVIYFGFIAVNLLYPGLMDKPFILGVNVAFVYGMGLIILAWVMALIYNVMSTRKEEELNQPEEVNQE